MQSVVKLTDFLYDICHHINGVLSSFGCGAVAGDALYLDSDFHTTSVAAVDISVCGLCDYNELRPDVILVYDVLPAKTVAILFLYGSRYEYCDVLGYETLFLHNKCAVY